MTTITLDRLTKSFSSREDPVLHDVSLHVHTGELVALLGPSGSGKSTILKLIAGIEQPDSGDIQFDDQSILAVSPEKRGAMLMFQKAYLFPFLNIYENISFGLKVRGTTKARMRAEVARMLDLVELPGIEHMYPGQLSGGQQQRVALARALIIQPRVLMLDEPLSNLDQSIRQTLQETIRRIQREFGITALLVTHDLHEAIAMSDRTAVLLNGRIEAFDRPVSVFQRPRTIAAARFMGIANFISGRVEGAYLHGHAGKWRLNAAGDSHKATFAIRPEHLHVHTEATPDAMPGTVRSATYNGEYVTYRVTIGMMELDARVYKSDMLPVGTTVFVSFPPEHLFEVQE